MLPTISPKEYKHLHIAGEKRLQGTVWGFLDKGFEFTEIPN